MLDGLAAEDLQALGDLHATGRQHELMALLANASGFTLGSAALRHLYGLVLANVGKPDAALPLLREAVELAPAEPLYAADLGVLLQHTGQWAAAFDAFEVALTAQPHHAVASEGVVELLPQLLEQVLIHRAAGEWSAASTLLQRIEQASPARSELAYLQALQAAEAGQWACADVATAAVLQLAEANTPLYQAALAVRAHLGEAHRQLPPRTEVVSTVAEDEWRSFGWVTQQLLEAAWPAKQADALRMPWQVDGSVSVPTWVSAWLQADGADAILAAASELCFWLRGEREFSPALSADEVLGVRVGGEATPAPLQDKLALLVAVIARCQHPGAVDAALCGLHLSQLAQWVEMPHKVALIKLAQGLIGRNASYHAVKFQPKADLQSLLLKRKQIVIIGSTCISQALLYLLRCAPDFRRLFSVSSYITHQHHQHGRDFDIPVQLIDEAEIVVHLAPGWVEWGNEKSYRQMLSLFDGKATRISFPYPLFQPLWPVHCEDPRRSKPHPLLTRLNDNELPGLPYGDSLLLELMRSSDDLEAVLEGYAKADLNERVNLDSLLERTLRDQRSYEQETDIKAADYIANNFRQLRLFQSVNHPANAFIAYVANQVLLRLGLPPLEEGLLARLQELIAGPWPPIHPSVVRHFGLSYGDPNVRLPVDGQRQLSLDEYVRFYVRFTAYADLGSPNLV